MNFIKKAWKGEEKLWKVFLPPLVIIFLVPALLNPIKHIYISTIFQYVIALLLVSYIAWYIVSLWRCAFNTKHKLCGYLARIFSAYLIIVVLVLTFYFLLALSNYSSI